MTHRAITRTTLTTCGFLATMVNPFTPPIMQYPGDTGYSKWEKPRHEREQREAVTMSRLGSAPVEATIK